MSDRIVMRTGESLVAGGPPFTAAERDVIVGELDGSVGTVIEKAMKNEPSIAWLLENQDKITHKYYERGLKGEI